MIIDPNGKSIGTVGLSEIKGNSCEISYMIGESASRGKEHAVEAINAMTQIAFDELSMKEIRARIIPENEVSLHVIGKAGYSVSEIIYKKTFDS